MAAERTFGSWLKDRRKLLDLTQDELAQRVGCSLMLVQKIETGERRASKQIAELLARCLGIPQDETADFVRFARSKQLAFSAADNAPWRNLRHTLTNLPVPPTPLFGREQDIEAIVRRIQHERVRLLTLVGPPGIGKTRLALACAERLLDCFEDGVFFVPLASIRDSELVAPTIARSLNLKEEGGQSALEILKKYLAGKRLLLVLDNLEQVITAAPLIAELLAPAPWLQMIVTSRISLHIRPERQFRVTPLALAPLDGGEWSKILSSPAIQFFVDRAQSVDETFELNEDNARAIAAICTRLDGLPLAVELVATRASSLSPQETLAQLTSRLKMSSEGPRDLPRRHQSLRDAIDWSYDLLSNQGQVLFAQLAVFVGGFTPEMVQAVCQPGLGDSLGTLANTSLIAQEKVAGGETRLKMLETLREYAADKLVERGQAEEVASRHAVYMCEFAEGAETHLTGSEQVEWMNRLDRDHSNLLAAMEWAVTRGEAELALRLGCALSTYWYRQDLLVEGRRWLRQALELPADGCVPLTLRLKALNGAGNLAWSHADYQAAEQLGRESYQLAMDIGDKRGLAAALQLLAGVAVDRVDYVRATELCEQNLAILRELGDTMGTAAALNNLGRIANYGGDSAQAALYYGESLALRRVLGDHFSIALALNNLGAALTDNLELDRAKEILEESCTLCQAPSKSFFVLVYTLVHLGRVALYSGDYAEAAKWLGEALVQARARESKTGSALALLHLGQLAIRQGNPAKAAALLREGVLVQREFMESGTWIRYLDTLAALLLARHDGVKAATLLGAVEGICERDRIRFPVACARDHAKNVETTCAELDEQTRQSAWQQGRDMTLAQACDFSLQVL